MKMSAKLKFLICALFSAALLAGIVLITCKGNTVFNIHRLPSNLIGPALLIYIFSLAATTLSTIYFYFKSFSSVTRVGVRVVSSYFAALFCVGLVIYVLLLHVVAQRYCD